jgi:hypothetical protein
MCFSSLACWTKSDFRKVPLIFVVHSMGGLIVKEVREIKLTGSFEMEWN